MNPTLQRKQQANELAANLLVSFMAGHTASVQVVNQLREINTPDALKVIPVIEALHETLKTHKNTDLSEVTAVLKDVLAETRAIPKELAHVDIPAEITVKNPVDNADDLQAILKAIQAIKFDGKPPIVNVAPTPVTVKPAEVHVEKTDLKPLSRDVQAVEKAVKGIVIPKHDKTDLTKLEKLQAQANKLLEEISHIRGGGGGGGMSSLVGTLANGSNVYVTAVESVDNPGTYGVVMLNPDGSSIGTGGGGGGTVTSTYGSGLYGTAHYA